MTPGQVQVFLLDEVPEVGLAAIAAEVSTTAAGRQVFHCWPQLPDHEALLQSVLQTLAEVVYRLWPDWYGQTALFAAAPRSDAALLNRYQCLDCQGRQPGVSLPWLQAAVRRRQQGQLPLFKRQSRALQFQQLALAIAPTGMQLVLAVADPQPPALHLRSLAQAAQWMATHCQAQVALWLPRWLSQSAALESVLYGAKDLPGLTAASPALVEENTYVVFPVQGRPHPFSPGEQKLAQVLGRDRELSALFRFNQTVRTVRDRTYLVDMVWAEGRVVVEIDGYRYHSNRFRFSQDRQRDYELLISGYVVLRLPHDEVISDVEVAIEKIRDVVQFRRQQSCRPDEVSP